MSAESYTLIIGLALLLYTCLPGPSFRLEQFDLPKDVTLGILGVVCALGVATRGPVPWESAMDAPIAACICWGGVLTLLVATNADTAWRTIGTFAAALSVFLLARRVGAEPQSEMLFRAISVEVAGVAAIVLLETYGGIPFISEQGRGPGGTLGNRNLAARIFCLSLPLLWRQMVLELAPATRRVIMGMVMLTISAIVISRSRGPWIISSVLVISLPLASRLLSSSGSVERVRTAAKQWSAAIIIGGLLAVLLPNRMGWTATDFESSASRTLDYQTGTGRGRVIQAQTAWRMIRTSPLVGFGPGNWSIMYAAFAPEDDPSVKIGAFYPAPRVPRNEVLSFVSEFGIPGLVLGVVSLIALFARLVPMLRRADIIVQHSGLMGLAIGGAAALLGLFDSIIRVAPTVGLLALMLGLVVGQNRARSIRARKGRVSSDFTRRGLVIGYAWASLIFARGALQDLAAFRILTSAKTIRDLYRAVTIAPNNVEARMVLAYVLVGANRCDLARSHLEQAARLQPFSASVRALGTTCDQRMRKP